MDHPTREQRRRETEVRLVESHADIAIRSGMLALLVKLRHRPRTASERESVHRTVARARLTDGTPVAVNRFLCEASSPR